MDYLERSIINIEIDPATGEKCVHYMGDSCYSDDGTNTPYRFTEYCWGYIPLADVLENGMPDGDWYNNLKQYITDCTEEHLTEIYEHYNNGKTPVVLPFKELTADTPCGCYII